MPLYVYRTPEKKLVIKATDKETAKSLICSCTYKETYLEQELEEWAVIDATNITEEDLKAMDDAKQMITKWCELKNTESKFKKQCDNLELPEISTDIININTYINNSADENINKYKSDLVTIRSKYVVAESSNEY